MFFCKQKTAYELRISDWSSDVCSSDLDAHEQVEPLGEQDAGPREHDAQQHEHSGEAGHEQPDPSQQAGPTTQSSEQPLPRRHSSRGVTRSEERWWREKVCQYVESSGVAGSLKEKKSKSQRIKNK